MKTKITKSLIYVFTAFFLGLSLSPCVFAGKEEKFKKAMEKIENQLKVSCSSCHDKTKAAFLGQMKMLYKHTFIMYPYNSNSVKGAIGAPLISWLELAFQDAYRLGPAWLDEKDYEKIKNDTTFDRENYYKLFSILDIEDEQEKQKALNEFYNQRDNIVQSKIADIIDSKVASLFSDLLDASLKDNEVFANGIIECINKSDKLKYLGFLLSKPSGSIPLGNTIEIPYSEVTSAARKGNVKLLKKLKTIVGDEEFEKQIPDIILAPIEGNQPGILKSDPLFTSALRWGPKFAEGFFEIEQLIDIAKNLEADYPVYAKVRSYLEEVKEKRDKQIAERKKQNESLRNRREKLKGKTAKTN